jgi:hypothetical protein
MSSDSDTSSAVLQADQIGYGVNQIKLSSVIISSDGVGSVTSPVFVFIPTNTISSGGRITISMPTGYFLGAATVTCSVSSWTGSASVSTSTSTEIIITTAGVAISSGVSVSMTLSGLTLGSARLQGSSSNCCFQMLSSADVVFSVALDAPAILASPTFTSVTFRKNNIMDFFGNAGFVEIVFSPGATIPVGSNITLSMPIGYFFGAATVTCSVSSWTGSASVSTSTSTEIIITTAGVAISSGVSVSVTLSGLTLGANRPSGIFKLSTSVERGAQEILAPAIARAVQYDRHSNFYLRATSGHPAKYQTFEFTPSTSLPIGGNITLHMPAGFYVGTAIVSFQTSRNSDRTDLVGTASPVTSTSTQLIIQISGVSIPSGEAVTMMLSGLDFGSVRAKTMDGFRISTSSDTLLSSPADAIEISSQLSFASISLNGNYTGTQVSPIIEFAPGPESVNVNSFFDTFNKITLTMPTGYFLGIANVSIRFHIDGSIVWATANAATHRDTTIVVSTQTNIFYKNWHYHCGGRGYSASFLICNHSATMTLHNLTLGAAQVGGMFDLSTNIETIDSRIPKLNITQQRPAPAIIGLIFSSILMSFNSIRFDVSPVIVFSLGVAIPVGGNITLSMPTGYFLGAATVTCSVSSWTGSASVSTSTSTEIIITTGVAISSGVSVSMTLSGLTLGAKRPSGIFKLSTSVERGAQEILAPAIENAALLAAAIPTTSASSSAAALLISTSAAVMSCAVALFFF